MNINITPEQARALLYELREWDKSDLISKLEKIAKPKEKDFDDCFVTGFDILGNSRDGYLPGIYFKDDVRQTTFRTQEQANAARALAQLTQWYGEVNEKNRKTTINSTIYMIYNSPYNGGIRVYAKKDFDSLNPFLAFNNEKAAQDFLDSHKTLIEQAKYFL